MKRFKNFLLRELTISPFYKQKNVYNPYYDIDKKIEAKVKKELKKRKVKFKKVNPANLSESFVWDTMLYSNLSSANWDLQSERVYGVIEKLKEQPHKIEDVFDKIYTKKFIYIRRISRVFSLFHSIMTFYR